MRDRPGRPGRRLRRRELRQQVPGRGGRVHGHRPRRHLRRGGGDRGRLPAVRAHAGRAGDTSPEAAIATAAYDTLTGLQPQLGANQAILDGDYTAYMAAVPDGTQPSLRPSRTGYRSVSRPREAVLATAGERRSWLQHHAHRPRTAGTGARRLAAQRHGAGARALPTRHAAARARECLAVPARRPQRPDEPGRTPTTSTR